MRSLRRFSTAWVLLLTGGIVLVYQIDWEKTEILRVSDPHHRATDNAPSLGDSDALHTGTGSQVLIYSRWRSGSSFLGDLFSSHPEVFYIYEPLKMFDISRRKMSQHWFETTGIGFVNVCECVFHNLKCLSPTEHIFRPRLHQASASTQSQRCDDAWDIPLIDHNGVNAKHLAEILNCNFSFIFDIPISALRNDFQTRKKFRTTFCRHETCQSVRELERKCRSRKHVVVKTIKIHSIELLEPFTQRGVKVIHLVRDPRSWLWSQYKLREFQAGIKEYDKTANNLLEILVTRNINEKCSSISRDLQSKHQQVMSQHPYTLRFEDLAASPLHYTHKLYDFLGINLHPNVTQFIGKAANYTGSDLNRPYSTKRNSTQVLERWRQEMPWRMVKRVQEVCSVVMETLHYSPAVNESMLRDLSVELTKPDYVS